MNQSAKARFRRYPFLFALVTIVGAAACNKGPVEGAYGGECYPNNTCNGSLVCQLGKCTDGQGSSTSASTSGGTSKALADALKGCFECGDSECEDASDECDAQQGCKALLECSLSCAGDVSCASGCDASGVSADGVQAMTAFTTCSVSSCQSECGQAIQDALVGGDGDGDGASATSGDGDGSPASLSEALEACFACGKSACTEEASSCESQAGCNEALECSLSCGTDADCVTSCDLSGITDEGVQALSDFAACSTSKCEQECGPDIQKVVDDGGSDTTGDGDTGTSGDEGGSDCSPEGDERYSCVESAPEVCVDGKWVAESCEGCGLVSPSGVCGKVSHLAFIKYSDELVSAVEPASSDFEQSATSVSADWTFAYTGYPQYGAVQYKFDQALEPSGISIEASGVYLVNIESNDGSSGCEYQLSGTTLIPNEDYYWDGCWGSQSDSRTVINLRTEPMSSGSVSLSVQSIDL